MNRPETSPDRPNGFALAMVVFVLFVIGMLGSTAYTVVSLEADLALQNDDATEAGAIARAGLKRYLAEHLGIPEQGDTTEYTIGRGTAKVSAYFMSEDVSDDTRHLYLVTSVGEVADPRYTEPSSKAATQYAWLQTEPIMRDAAVMASYDTVRIEYWGVVDGNDYSGGSCSESGEDVYGIAHRGQYQEFDPWCGGSGCVNVDGRPADEDSLWATHSGMEDRVRVRWDVLTDPDFPIEYDGVFPNFWQLPSDEYPVVRTSTNFTASSSISGGRGVLIVPGRLTISSGFQWNGIVMAGEVADTSWRWWRIFGMMIIGMNGSDGYVRWGGMPLIYYDVCRAIDASNALSYFEPVEGSLWEEG